METSCFLSCLSKYKGTCGNSRGVKESVRLEDCNESITNHLNTCQLSRETLTESQLILARAGIFDFPVSKLSETMICPKHRHTLGKYWKQRRPCQYPTHKGGKKAVNVRSERSNGEGNSETSRSGCPDWIRFVEYIFPAFSVLLFWKSGAYLRFVLF